MSVSRIFMLIVLLIVGAVVALLLVERDSLTYMLVGAMAIVGVALLIVFYFNVMRPLRIIAGGVELLRGQDFSSRLAHVGQPQADRIVDLFNAMMLSLKQERLRLREQNHFLDLLIDVSPMGIILLNSDGAVSDANRAAAQFLDIASPREMLSMKLDALPGELGRELASLAEREVRVVRLNTSMVYRLSRLSFMESGKPHPFLLIERLTDEVMKAERKSYEKVIRMMAHEVNNSLAPVISVIDTAVDDVADPDLREAIRACRSRCLDMGAFITKFAEAVKIPDPVKRNVSLRAFLTERIPLFESICAAVGARLTVSLDETERTVFVDPVLIEQALTNIVKNAAESAGQDGHVTISTDDSASCLVITDDGPGITPEAAGMLFTPFFTTKPSGHGLGLLLVSEVLNSHSCRFSLSTDPDRLTRFSIRF